MGELEAAVMKIAWAAAAPLTVREVLDTINARRRQHKLAYTTVLSVVSNLYGKGLLARHPQGRAFAYSPVVSQEEYTAALMSDALAGALDRSSALLHFAAELDEADRAALLRYSRRRRAGS